MAVKGGFEQAVAVLLEKGADVNYLDQVSYRQIFNYSARVPCKRTKKFITKIQINLYSMLYTRLPQCQPCS